MLLYNMKLKGKKEGVGRGRRERGRKERNRNGKARVCATFQEPSS